MKSFCFNKIYVIESLPADDRQTGRELYDDLLRYESIKYPQLSVEYRSIVDKSAWDVLMEEIAMDCVQNGNQVILHIEIHGAEILFT